MHNLFVINTPMQLLTAYILANSIAKGTHNHILLLHPSGYEFWDKTVCLNHMATDTNTWQQISLVKRWINRSTKISSHKQQIEEMRTRIFKYGPVDQVFLGSDKIIQNQLLVELAVKDWYYRMDEGVGSYDCRDRHWASKIWQAIRIKYFRTLGGLNTGMKYNYNGIGYGQAAAADYLYKPEILGRFSPNPIKIERETVHEVIEKLTKDMPLAPELCKGDCIMFLSSPFVESGWYTAKKEVEILKKIYNMAVKNDLRLIYKTHPSEDYGKLNYYKEEMPYIDYFQSVEPIEAVYYRHDKIKLVFSYASSGMLNADIFARNPVIPVSLYKIYNLSQDRTGWKPTMQKAKIRIPEDWKQLEEIITGGGSIE